MSVSELWIARYLAAAFTVVGCSASKTDELPTLAPNAGASGATAASGGAGGASLASGGAFTGPTGTSGAGVTLPLGGRPADASGGRDATCTAEFARTDLESVYLAFAFDVSGSMGKLDKPYHDPVLKWEPVVAATKAFFADSSARGIEASLTFFPSDDDRCESQRYLEPDVAMTALPSAVFASAIDAVTPSEPDAWRGGTPTLAVLQGIFDSLSEPAQPDARGTYAVVLVSDGYPQGCDEEEDDIEAVASVVASNAARLSTYVIGVANPPGGPDTVTNLNRLAVAGGTASAFLIATGDPGKTARDFQSAIAAIRGQTVSCEARIPENPGGQPVDPDRVNVTLSSAGNAARLGYDESCASERSFRFDDPTTPTKIVLCDSTCQAVRADASADLTVEFGCERVNVVPR